MPNVQHSALTGTDLHECKGIATATAGQVYVANGAGSGTWKTMGAYGGLYAQGSVSAGIPATGAWTKFGPTVSARGSPANVTEGTTGRLTYTGSETRRMVCSVNGYWEFLSNGAGNFQLTSAYISVLKNGSQVPGTQQGSSFAGTSSQVNLLYNIEFQVSMATNDYLEVCYYCTTAGFAPPAGSYVRTTSSYPYNFHIFAI